MRIIVYSLSSLFLLAACTQTHYEKGMKAYDQMAYQKASQHLEKYLEKKTDSKAALTLAEAYRKMDKFEEAEKAYSKALQNDEASLSNREKYKYAQLLAMNGKTAEATKWGEAYLSESPDDEQAKAWLETLKNPSSTTAEVEINEIKVSGFEASFSPVPYGGIVYFVGEKKAQAGKKTNPWTGGQFYDIYAAKKNDFDSWKSVESAEEFNNKWHDGPFCLNKEGSKAFVSRSSIINKKIVKDEASINQLHLYELKKAGDTWEDAASTQSLNKAGYSSMHPTISKDGMQLYFCSDIPGGEGGMDLYVANRSGNSWSSPKNLGKALNSSKDEVFPFLAKEDTLYFASNRPESMGGLDIFYSVKTDGQWGDAIPLASPFNSAADDFGFYQISESNKGYLSSNRAKKDKIYSWIRVEVDSPKVEEPVADTTPVVVPVDTVVEEPVVQVAGPVVLSVKGKVVNKKTRELLNGVDVKLMLGEAALNQYTTQEDGTFSFKLDSNQLYHLHAGYKNSFSRDQRINTNNSYESKVFEVLIELEIVEENTTIELNNIYYDYNAASIRSDAVDDVLTLITFMKENPKVKIQINAHTDSKGRDEDNLVLSKRRARAVRRYMVKKGISEDRIIAKGFGETQLVNDCDDGVDCTEEQHQANRRTEFTVLKIDD